MDHGVPAEAGLLARGDTTRVVAEVVAGLIPGGDPDPRFAKRFSITSAAWYAASAAGTERELLAERNGEALGYAGLLMLQPDAVNWVRVDWIWF